MINRDESELIAREQRNQRSDSKSRTERPQWQRPEAANDDQERQPFRTVVNNRATRYLIERP